MLRVGAAWLAEQESDPAAHDVLAMAGRLGCPLLVVHGENDETVPVESARAVAQAGKGRLVLIPQSNHVFNTPNPPPQDVGTVPALAQAVERIIGFAKECCSAST
jgi:pimeloyl-ACP methyl ester carboxylesterase